MLPDLVKEVENYLPPNMERKPVLPAESNGKDVTLTAPAEETASRAAQQVEKSEKMTVKAVIFRCCLPIY